MGFLNYEDEHLTKAKSVHTVIIQLRGGRSAVVSLGKIKMMRNYWLGAFILPYLVISACTSLSQDECRKGNWFEIGQIDGTKGRVLSAFKDQVKACNSYSSKPDIRLYKDGRTFGLARYCTSSSGFKAGRFSRTYQNVCPSESQGEFIKGYRLGTQLDQAESKLSDVTRNIAEIETGLAKGKLSPEQRALHPGQLVKLKEEQRRLKGELLRIRTTARQTL